MRIDQQRNVRDRVSFFGANGTRLASASHEPVTRPPLPGGLVICPSICNDFTKNYRREVVLGRELAARGFSVQRFHYRGTGNSDGDPEGLTVETMAEDTLVAAAQLDSSENAGRLAFMGTRFGALPAAAAATRHPGAALVLVDPTIEGHRYFREAWRAKMSRELKDETAESMAAKSLEDELAATGSVDVLGNSIHEALYRSAKRWRLVDTIDGRTGNVLLLQLGAGKGLRPDNERLVAHLKSQGCIVDVEIVGDTQKWWFLDDSADTLTELVPTIADWTVTQLRNGIRHG